MSKAANSDCVHIGTDPGSEYSADEVEFIKAVDRWCREHKRRYPTATEILAVAKSLGYGKIEPEQETAKTSPAKT